MADLTSEVQALEEQVKALRRNAFDLACDARNIWEELGEGPEDPRDACVQELIAKGGMDDVSLSPPLVASIRSSHAAWDARRKAAATEREWLHAALWGFGTAEDIEPFLAEYDGLNVDHRIAFHIFKYAK